MPRNPASDVSSSTQSESSSVSVPPMRESYWQRDSCTDTGRESPTATQSDDGKGSVSLAIPRVMLLMLAVYRRCEALASASTAESGVGILGSTYSSDALSIG